MIRLATLALTVAAASALAACSGGGSPSTPTPISSIAPKPTPVAYTASIVWSGYGATNADRGVSIARRRDAGATSAATPGPIVLTAPNCAYPCLDRFAGGPSQAADSVSMLVNPQPSASVSPTFNDADSSVSIASPTPNTGASPNPSATPYAIVETVVPGQVKKSTMTAVDATTNTTTQQTVYIYGRLTLECHVESASVNDGVPVGVSISSGVITAVTDPAKADVYLDGPNCEGLFHNTTETQQTLHFPFGATTFGTQTQTGLIALPDVTTAAYANSFVAYPYSSYTTNTPEGYLFQTAQGNIVKFQPRVAAGGDATNNAYYSGAYAQHAFGVDTF